MEREKKKEKEEEGRTHLVRKRRQTLAEADNKFVNGCGKNEESRVYIGEGVIRRKVMSCQKVNLGRWSVRGDTWHTLASTVNSHESLSLIFCFLVN